MGREINKKEKVYTSSYLLNPNELRNKIQTSDKFTRFEIYEQLNDWLIEKISIPNDYISIINMGLMDSYFLVRISAMNPFEVHNTQIPFQTIKNIFLYDPSSWVRGEAGLLLALTKNNGVVPLLECAIPHSRGVERIHLLVGLIILDCHKYFGCLIKTIFYQRFDWFSFSLKLIEAYIDFFNDYEKNMIFISLRNVYSKTPKTSIAKLNMIETFFKNNQNK